MAFQTGAVLPLTQSLCHWRQFSGPSIPGNVSVSLVQTFKDFKYDFYIHTDGVGLQD